MSLFFYSRRENMVCANLEYEMDGGVMKCESYVCRANDEHDGMETTAQLNRLADEGDGEAIERLLLSRGVLKFSLCMIGCKGSVEYSKRKQPASG